ncbi:ABC transporter substrate-binding protein [Parasphingorhabdus halotolerans]|uniref:ABC transporter substrate-binding protein n=1 Tax=Parasphingorhabdus halotolerans TaxID=2725558 RepID=A0A6H2DJZ2_9SPHN|nr:ABC transporter substrate-binding protein [Parasphingorhabdus halotolerans]QJB68265.1 ABC transporter substrate-binding protein [Parasphingorhabdus halotolerans]
MMLLASCSAYSAEQDAIIDDKREVKTIVSANPCVDAILVELVEPERIASLSHYSHSAGSSSMDIALASRFPANGGTAEEIIALDPDIVLLGSHTPKATLDALQASGIKVHLIGVPDSVAQSLDQIEQIALAVNEKPRGDILQSKIRAAVDAASTGAKQARPKLLIWQAGGLVPGEGTLIDDMIGLAGFANASADYRLAMWDILPLEPVAKNPPDLILSPSSAKSGESRNVHLRTKFLKKFGDQVVTADIPENLLHCGGTTIISAMNVLKNARNDYQRQNGT